MIHETMHIFMDIIETQNKGRTAGTPVVDANLDRTSYATLKTTLESALLPFVTQIRQLPSFASPPPGMGWAFGRKLPTVIFMVLVS